MTTLRAPRMQHTEEQPMWHQRNGTDSLGSPRQLVCWPECLRGEMGVQRLAEALLYGKYTQNTYYFIVIYL